MLVITILFNFLLFFTENRRYRGGGARGAGIAKVTKTFGNGVASLIKDIKQGNWDEEAPQFDERRDNRFVNDRKYFEQMGNDTTFYVSMAIITILIVAAIMYYIIKVIPKLEKENVAEQMKKRNQERFKHYQALKIISENGVHPDKAFGRLQKIRYKEKQ